MTESQAEQAAARLDLDDDKIRLPKGLSDDVTYDILLNGQLVWAIRPGRDARERRRGPVVAWPKALRRHLRAGHARVTLREHTTGTVIAAADHDFGGDGSREISVTDKTGNPLVMDKWNRLSRQLAGEDSAALTELIDRTLDLLADIEKATGLPAFICYGTLLGAVRNGRLIGHDNDLDVAYASAVDHPADVTAEGFRVERALRAAGWRVRRGSGVRLNVRIPLGDGTARFVDVFTACWIEDILYIPSDTGVRLPRETILPLGTVELMGRQVPAPAQPEVLLAATYGENWRVPDPSFKYESPESLHRHFAGWFGGLATGRKTWDQFAKTSAKKVPDAPTRFARWVARNYPTTRPLVDLGCGTGRDTVWFANKHARPVHGVDYSGPMLRHANQRLKAVGKPLSVELTTANLCDERVALSLGAALCRTEEPVDLYGRFLLHCLRPMPRENIFRLASMSLRRGGYLFLEFRTTADRDLPHVFTDVKRWYLDPDEIQERIESHGGRVVYRTEGTGLAPFRREDPHVCRIVAAWADAEAATP